MEQRPLEELRQFLAKLSPGQVPLVDQPRLVQLLQNCWHMLSGSGEEGMGKSKVVRMEDPKWKPPLLMFTIERHGATALGSTRAALQDWIVDIHLGVAEYHVGGYRQLYPRAAAFDVRPVADELSNLVICGSQDERLQWSATGRVRILTGKILPGWSKQTLEGQRKRFLRAMEERLAPHGWSRHGSWWEQKE